MFKLTGRLVQFSFQILRVRVANVLQHKPMKQKAKEFHRVNLKVQINAVMAKVKVVLFTFFIIFPNDYVTKTASNSVQMNESLKKRLHANLTV